MAWTWEQGVSGHLVVDGRKLETLCLGPSPGDAPTLVLLHEGLGCVELWRDFPDKLAAVTGWGVLAYSRAGYGRSDSACLPRPVDYMTSEAVEKMYLDVVGDVKWSISLPVAVKIGPFFSSLPRMAQRFSEVGANGLVMFNRFYQPDFDLDNLEVVPHLVLSTAFEMRLPLRWVALLYGRVPVDFAITSGVRTYEDVLKGLMAGANVMMMASEILRNGIGRISEVTEAMRAWMTEHEYTSVQQMQGSMSQKNVTDPAAFERANYMKVLQSWRTDPTARKLYG